MNCYRMELEQKQKILEMSQKYDRQLRDMRACLGFLFGRVGMQKEDVPKWLAEKLVDSYAPLRNKMASKELYSALGTFEARLNTLLKVSEDGQLQREHAQLLRIVADEQRQRRQLMN